jgi:hypothetical protein
MINIQGRAKRVEVGNSPLRSIISIPFYAVLLPLVPGLMIYAANTHRLTPQHGASNAFAVIAGYIALNGILRFFIRRPEIVDPALAVTFLAVILPLLFRSVDSAPLLVAVGWLIAVCAIYRFTFAQRVLPVFLNVMTALIIGQYLISIISSPVWSRRPAITELKHFAFAPVENLIATRKEQRDIYYLVFDRYARADQLQEIYNYDNSDFLDALKERGFSVADNSFANYQRTIHSLLSSLNFDYLDRLDEEVSAASPDWVPLYSMVDDTRIVRFLKRQGYRIHHFGSWWEPTRMNKVADVSHNWFSIPEILRVIYEHSLIVHFVRLIGLQSLDPRWMQCQRSRLMFKGIWEIEDQNPKFVFAHFLVPHPPFVTYETGRCMSISEATSRSREENYIGQLRYVNGEIIRLVDALQRRAGPKPVIILQSDEGPWPKKYAGDEIIRLGRDVSRVDWSTAGAAELREKLAILSAVYLPDANIVFPNDASPVNTFRKILRHYFGVQLPGRSHPEEYP